MKALFTNLLYEPLYNALVGLIDILPGGSIGLAVIILTIIVKFVLFPLSAQAIRTQLKMKEIEGELKQIREDYKDSREEMGRKMLELYRENKINPFSSIFLILIQLPVIIALYFVFTKAGFPEINTSLLYSFIPQPEFVNTVFLGFIDLASNKNVLIAILAAVSQYYQIKFTIPKAPEKKEGEGKGELADHLARTMQTQMKFIMPIITLAISFGLVSVVGLYWLVSNLFSIVQELYIRKKIRNPHQIAQQNQS